MVVNTPKLTLILIFVTISAALVFGFLWQQERQRKPFEVTRDIPKEVIREVQIVKEVEVPATLTPEQQIMIDVGRRFLSANLVETTGDALYKMDSIRLDVHLDDAIKQVLSEDRARNKFELVLRKYGIKIDENASTWLRVTIEGFWDEDRNNMSYISQMQTREIIVLARKGDFRKVSAALWEDGSLGRAGKARIESVLLDSIESNAESFANSYLTAHAKSK